MDNRTKMELVGAGTRYWEWWKGSILLCRNKEGGEAVLGGAEVCWLLKTSES